MTVGWAIVIVGVLTLLVYNEGFRWLVGMTLYWAFVIAGLYLGWQWATDLLSPKWATWLTNVGLMLVGLVLFGVGRCAFDWSVQQAKTRGWI
jgi:uncharacterized membrane protein YczE